MSEWIRCDERKPEEGVYVFGAIYGTDIVIQQPPAITEKDVFDR